MPPPPRDLELLDRILAGEEEAFASLVERHQAMLVRLAMVFVRDRAVAEEVVQEVWMAALEGLSRFERRASVKSWLVSIAANLAKTRGQRERRSTPFSALAPPGDENALAVDPARFAANGGWASPPERWDEETPERLSLRRESREWIEMAIGQLPEQQRAVMTMRDIDGLGSDEVCNVLGISETNQRVLLHRARSKVRAALEQYLAGEVNRC